MTYAKYECILKQAEVHEDICSYTITQPDAVIDFLRRFTDLADYPEEHVYVLFLNTKQNIVGYTEVGIGGRAAVQVEISAVFRNAILLGANGIVLAHNHPSGDPTPSSDDINLTNRVAKAGKIIGVQLFDHIILCRDGSTSLKEIDLMPNLEKY